MPSVGTGLGWPFYLGLMMVLLMHAVVPILTPGFIVPSSFSTTLPCGALPGFCCGPRRMQKAPSQKQEETMFRHCLLRIERKRPPLLHPNTILTSIGRSSFASLFSRSWA